MRPDERPKIHKVDFNTLNNVKDVAGLDSEKGECADICNCYQTVDGVQSRRQGYTITEVTTACRNAFTTQAGGFYVSGGTLYQYPDITVGSISGEVCYCDLEDTLVYSSLVGTKFHPDWIDISVHELDAEFEEDISEFSAQALAYWNGRLYLGVSGELICSKPFKFSKYDYRQKVAATFTDGIVGLAALNSGLYVFTRSQVYFLSGSDPFNEDFKQQIVLPYGAMPGNHFQTCPAGFVNKEQSGKAVLFVSLKGICVGFEGGQVLNLSQDNISYPLGTSCTGVLMERDGANVYIINILNNDNTPYNANNAWVMDIDSF